MIPTIGRVVHMEMRVSGAISSPRAAIITDVEKRGETIDGAEDTEENLFDVCMMVLLRDGYQFEKNVPFSKEHRVGHWTWPPRV